jgi:tRNA(adenine34) deaminase
MKPEHEDFMRRCLELAREAIETGDTPVGALVVREGRILAEGIESVRAQHDVAAHAEIVALRAAAQRLGSIDLGGCTLYTSVEPCIMCAYAIRLARIGTVVTGARVDPAGAGMASLMDPAILPTRPAPSIISSVLAGDCLTMLDLQR